jgi:P-type Ca2+ transporter type 2C
MSMLTIATIMPTNPLWRLCAAHGAAHQQHHVAQPHRLLALPFRGLDICGINEKANSTMIFNALVLCQVFNESNTREI